MTVSIFAVTRGLIALLGIFALPLCVPAFQIAVNPFTVRSRSGNKALWVNPSDRYGRGPAFYRLTRGAKIVWKGNLPYTLSKISLGEDGSFGGCGLDVTPHDQGLLTVAYVSSKGVSHVLDRIIQRPSPFADAEDLPDPEDVALDLTHRTLFVWLYFGDSGPETGFEYSLSTGTKIRTTQPRSKPIVDTRAAFLPGKPRTRLPKAVSLIVVRRAILPMNPKSSDIEVEVGGRITGSFDSPKGEGTTPPIPFNPAWQWYRWTLYDENGKPVGSIDRWPDQCWVWGHVDEAPDGSLAMIDAHFDYAREDDGPNKLAFYTKNGIAESQCYVPEPVGESFSDAFDGHRVYYATDDGLYAVTRKGKIAWRFKPNGWSDRCRLFQTREGLAVFDGDRTVTWYDTRMK